MFTGIIEEVGTIRTITPTGPRQWRLSVGCRTLQADMKIGDSVAVDGVCLTAVGYDAATVDFEISPETIEHTVFKSKPIGARMNLERALRLTDRLGGHLVQGHIDGKARLLAKRPFGGFFEIAFALPSALKPYVAYKGSIAVNGISLTVASLSDRQFVVAVIPHTYRHTNLSELEVGDEVHLESDIVARYIEKLMTERPEAQRQGSEMTLDFLKQHGY
jgi:riboflavin synthase